MNIKDINTAFCALKDADLEIYILLVICKQPPKRVATLLSLTPSALSKQVASISALLKASSKSNLKKTDFQKRNFTIIREMGFYFDDNDGKPTVYIGEIGNPAAWSVLKTAPASHEPLRPLLKLFNSKPLQRVKNRLFRAA